MPPKRLTKQNSTKAQRRAANGLPPFPRRPNPTRRTAAHTATGRTGDSAALYKHCVTGPVAMPSMNVGFPDGDGRPSVTMDFRRTYTLVPVEGEVSFGLGTSYYGCFIKGRGVMRCPTDVYASAILPSGAMDVNNLGPASIADAHTGLVPIIAPDTSRNFFPSYRPIVAVAEVSFTGSSMHNGGAVVVGKTSTSSFPNRTFGSSVDLISYQLMGPSPALTGSSVVGPARDTYVSRIVPADPEYIPAQISATTAPGQTPTLVTNGLLSAGFASADRKMYSLPSPQAGAVWYTYSGLDDSATITVNVRYCVQYTVGGSSEFVPLAKPSPPPPANPGVISRLFSALTSSPAALQFAANATGHLLPATRPLLAIAADAYNHT